MQRNQKTLSTRRQFLKNTATAAAVAAFTRGAFASPSQLAAPDDTLLVPFSMSSVRLAPGVFSRQAEINARYLDSLTPDRLLHSFRLTAGLPSSAQPYGGWEKPDCELRGHFNGGHYLSAAALAYASSGNEELRKKGDAVVAGLAECQKKIGTGYVSAFPETLFEKLAQGQPVWAPFYTYHKIMAGLLDMHQLTGNPDALQVVEGMARWVGDYLYPISRDQRLRMLRTEYGGMNEVLVNLAAVTQKDRYIETAHLFEQPAFLDPLAARRDELQGLHANTHVPKVIGAARMYEVTGDRRYRDIAQYFLGEVLSARTYVIGNTSEDEHWLTPADQLKGTLTLTNAECCVAYNLMKLERHVFGWTADARWMDAYERALLNCRLGTQNADGLKQYFFPLAAGYWRAVNSPEDSFWCCTGTGAEEFAKFNDTIYFRRGKDIYVNQFLASTLDWKDENLSIEQQTNFPVEQGTTLRIRTSHPQQRTIHVRIPAWTSGAALKINGRPVDAISDPGSYTAITRTWHDGDTIALQLPMRLTQEVLVGDDATVAALYGPMVLAADLGPGPQDGPTKIIHGRGTTPPHAPKPDPLPKIDKPGAKDAVDWIEPAGSSTNLRFKASANGQTQTLMPMYQIEDQRYAVYWDRGSAPRTA
ncbi:MAG: beta-L-arabinofuranosidase domain-containing protein [Acidobacteriota bacterium]